MPTRAQLQKLVASGASYGEIAAKYGVSAGRVYMIVTGLPADGSDVLGPEWLADRVGVLAGSSQHLANPPTEVPTQSDSVRGWLRDRAHADQTMQAAAAERTLDPPPVDDSSESEDIVDLLGRQHNQVKYLVEELQALPAEASDAKQAVLDLIRDRLEPHENAEQKYLWPAVRRAVPGGDALAEQGEEQEQLAHDLLQRDEVDVAELSTALAKHVAFEDYVFLQLTEHLSEAERSQIGKQVEEGN